MTDKQKIMYDYNAKDCEQCNPDSICCYCKNIACYALEDQYSRKEQEYEELRQYHNKCCKEFEIEKQELLEKYNQVSINFYNGDYCNTEYCNLLKAKEQECENWKCELDKTHLLMLEKQNALLKSMQECEELKEKLEKIKEFRHNYCMNCEDLLKPSHSCKGCNMVTLKQVIED